jgi:hypothetical protein
LSQQLGNLVIKGKRFSLCLFFVVIFVWNLMKETSRWGVWGDHAQLRIL